MHLIGTCTQLVSKIGLPENAASYIISVISERLGRCRDTKDR